MSITDELRKYVNARPVPKGSRALMEVRDRFNAIADRIEVEHEKALAEQFNSLTVDMKPMTEENMAEEGWVRLPVDADGVSINVGDKLDGYKETIVVEEMALQYGSWALVNEDQRKFYCPEAFTHHKATVEDVLREFKEELRDAPDDAIAELTARYARRAREVAMHE